MKKDYSKEMPGFLSNLAIFQDAFPRLKPIPGLSRSFDFPELVATLLLQNIMKITF